MNRTEFLKKYPNRMTLETFEKAVLTEKAIDWDGKYGEQCVDLARFYFHCVLGIPQPAGVDGAQDFFLKFYNDKVLMEHFERIKNYMEFIPEPGDVAIWEGHDGNRFGHISIVTGPSSIKTLMTLDQNVAKYKITKQEHGYTNFLGVLRPKKMEG